MNRYFINPFDFLNHESTIALIQGYFKNSGFLGYKVRMDDFIAIIYKYIFDNEIISIENNYNHKRIQRFSMNPIYYIDALNKQFIIAGSDKGKLLLSLNYMIIYKQYKE